MTEQPSKPSPATGAQARPHGEPARSANRLQAEPSLYLRQHAHNPVAWYPWGDEALAKAKAEDKPIFLSIGYSSCHWCHVMEHEVFEDEQVAELLNRFFVCIKVDREERPDLDAVYMEAVQAMSGRGGWPLSVFLTPALQPFFGGTYFPRERFLALANRVREVFAEHRAELEEKAGELAARITELPRVVTEKMGGVAVDAELISGAAAQGPAQFDMKWGGFGGDQKFPTPARWQFLLHHHRKTGDVRSSRLVELTLAAMASGGIYDHVGGGFHRYTVERTWLIPHFEKMLYDNAQLASLYLEAGVALGRPEFVAVGRDVLEFLLREMSAPAGGLYSSFDADSGGEEGSYYVWDGDDIALALGGGDDVGPLAALLGVEPGGNFEGGKTVLTRRADLAEVAKAHERPQSEVSLLFNRHRSALRAFRDRRPRPALDTKIIASWNGLAITAFAHGFAATGEQRFREAAIRIAAYMWHEHWRDDGRLARTTNDGAAGPDGILDDHALLACGLFDLYQITGEVEHLARALALVDLSRERFADPGGGFFLTATTTAAPLGRKVDLFDSVIPSGNAAMLHALIRAEVVTGRAAYRTDVSRTLSRYAGLMQRAGLEMAWWHDAALRHLGPHYLVVVAGDPGAADTQALADTVLRELPPHAVLVRVPASGATAELAAAAPATAGKAAVAGRAAAYVCEHGACQAPVTEPEALRRLLFVDWHR